MNPKTVPNFQRVIFIITMHSIRALISTTNATNVKFAILKLLKAKVLAIAYILVRI